MKLDISIRRDKNISLVVPLELAKANSRIDHTHEDTLLEVKLRGVIAAAEAYTERIYQPRNIKINVSESFQKLELPSKAPISKDNLEISYYDTDGNKQVVPAERYQLFSYNNGYNQNIVMKNFTFPTLQAEHEYPIEIKSTVSEFEVPDDVVSAILLLFTESETYRESRPQNITNTTAINLLRAYRRY